MSRGLGEQRALTVVVAMETFLIDVSLPLGVAGGVPREIRDNLFSRFVTTKTEGLGLGLSVSKSIIEAHGGRIRAISNGRQGATFAFTLPIAGGSTP